MTLAFGVFALLRSIVQYSHALTWCRLASWLSPLAPKGVVGEVLKYSAVNAEVAPPVMPDKAADR